MLDPSGAGLPAFPPLATPAVYGGRIQAQPTLVIPWNLGTVFTVDGSATVAAIAPAPPGVVITLDFTGTPMFKNSAKLVIPGGADIVFAAGDSISVMSRGNGVWRLLGPLYASNAETRAQASTTKVLTPANLASRACFSAHKNGTDQTGIAAGTLTKVTFTTEAFDNGGYYDAANSRWTPPAGYVRISGNVYFTAIGTGAAVAALFIHKNGSPHKLFTLPVGNSFGSAPGTIIDLANGTDYYEAYGLVDGTGTKTIFGDTAYTYFQGEQV